MPKVESPQPRLLGRCYETWEICGGLRIDNFILPTLSSLIYIGYFIRCIYITEYKLNTDCKLNKT